MTTIRKTIQGQEVELTENSQGMWSYRLVNAVGWHGKVTRFIMHSQSQAEGRAAKFIDQYYRSQSND